MGFAQQKSAKCDLIFVKGRVDKTDGQLVENIPVSHNLPTALPTRYDLI